jgi:hypothetical protein
MDEQEIHHLLQLKTFEEPSSEAIGDFIFEFQRRQRVAALIPSLFEVWKEQWLLFISEFQVPRMAYIAATALALISSVGLFFYQGSNSSGSGAENYPVVAKGFSINNSYPSLIPQSSLIPVSFQMNGKADEISSPAPELFENNQDGKKSLMSF